MKNNRFMNVLLKAKEENIAVGAVNIFNYLTAEAAVKAAEEIGVNLIIQTSAGTVEHFGAHCGRCEKRCENRSCITS